MSSTTFKVKRVFPINHKSTKAFVDLQYGNLLIKGFRVVEKKEDGKLFVSMPSQFDEKQESFFPTVMTLRDETKSAIDKFVLEAYADAVKTAPVKKKRGRPKKS